MEMPKPLWWNGGTERSVVSKCPEADIQQAQWVQANIDRLKLGGTRRETANILGVPAHLESYLLSDNSAIDVLYYHTPSTACQSMEGKGSDGLIPLVFQNDKLLGYGQGYYHNMVVPHLRQPLGMPMDRQIAPFTPSVEAKGSVGKGQPLR